jgi:hypothetical protein
MKNLSAADIAAKYAQRAGAAAGDYTAGIDRVTEAPGQRAAAAQDKMLRKVTEAVQSGKWGERVASVGLTEWKNAAKTKGGARYASGVEAGKGKMQAFMTEFIPHLQQLDGILASMPSVTVEDGVNRAAAAIRHNAKFRRSGR